MCYKKFDEEFMLNDHIVAKHPVKIRLDNNKPAKRGRGRPPKEAVHKNDHGLPSVHCHLCVATFKNYYFLKQHLDKEHADDPDRMKGEIKCPLCKQTFSRGGFYRRHFKVQYKSQCFQCAILEFIWR